MQPNKNKWSTKIRLPSLTKENATLFLNMSYRVARLYGVTKDAEWLCIPLGDNYYELWAEYEIKPFYPIKKKKKPIKIKRLPKRGEPVLQPHRQ